LHKNNLPQLITLFISACGAPHIPNPNPHLHKLADSEFLKSLKDLNGTPSEVLHQPELMQLLLPTLRADFELIETYQFTTTPPLNCPIVAFGGLDDPRIRREQVEGWSSQTTAAFRSQFFPGDHFFINTEKESITEFITKEINTEGTGKIKSV
jgi:medium-chain acyl-[acyl-carrier-protein] hydrolase